MNGPPPAVAERIAPPAVNRPFVAPPLLLRPPISVRPPVPTGYQTVSGSAVPPPAPPPARGLALYAEPVALLRALRLPVTPTNVASARLALESPQRLQNALAILERALPSSIDPRVTTLRTLAGFLTRIEPQSPTLATQIASYVDHVLEGSEPKLAQLLVARDAVAQAQPRPPAGAEPNAAAPLPTYPSTQLAHAAERQAALQYDFKSTLLSLAQSPPPGGGEELATALGGVLAALTALQVNAATTLAANPNGLAIAIPIALPNGIAQAHVRVDRHAPEAKNVPLDGDNFHIAFVLETQHFGIVAIDLVTVGRTVTLGVKTEATLAARAFNGALGKLTERLEKLRYHVARADALVAAVGTTTVVETSLGKQQMGDPADPTKLVDRSA